MNSESFQFVGTGLPRCLSPHLSNGCCSSTASRKQEAKEIIELQHRVSGRRKDVQIKRTELQNQKRKCRQSRAAFQARIVDFVRAADAVMASKPSDPMSLHTQRSLLDEAMHSFAHEESITDDMEHELSNLEYWLNNDESHLYTMEQDNPATYTISLSDDENEGRNSSTVRSKRSTLSRISSSTMSQSIATRLRQKSQQVDMIQEELDELDHNHATDIDWWEFNGSNGVNGNDADPANPDFVEIYQAHRASLVDRLVAAEQELHQLQAEAAADAPFAILEGQKPTALSPKKTSKLVDGVLRRFPGTYNGSLGFGLRIDRVATGYMSFRERVELWREHLPLELTESLSYLAPPDYTPDERYWHQVEDDSSASSVHGFESADDRSTVSTSTSPRSRTGLSIWEGEKSTWRNSNPDLYLIKPLAELASHKRRRPKSTG